MTVTTVGVSTLFVQDYIACGYGSVGLNAALELYQKEPR